MTYMRSILYIVLLSPLSVMSQYNYSVDKIPSELLNDADAVVRNETISINIKSQSSYTYTIDETVTVLNKDGDYDLSVGYSKSSKIKSLQAYIYDSQGKEVKKLKKKNFKDYSATGSSTFHDDSRMLYYEHATNDYPYTMRLAYTIETPNTVFIPRWQPISSYSRAVEKSIYTLTYPDHLDVRFLENNFEEYEIEKTKIAGGYSYTLENIPKRKYEVMSPPLYEMTPLLSVALDQFHLEGVDGTATSWDEFGKWYYDNLLVKQRELPSSLVAEVKLLTKGITDPIEKARKIYEFVQKRSRYISIQLGIGGWKPTPASEVHDLGYGDCKGLTNYTYALLEAVGVESFYCPVYAGNFIRDIKSDFYNMQGNHVILCIPDPRSQDSIWVECTSQEYPLGYIGDFTDDRDLLVISPEGGKIQHTTTYDETNSVLSLQAIAILSEEGNLNLQLEKRNTGIFYDRKGISTLNNQETQELYNKEFNHLGNSTIEDFEHVDSKTENLFEEKLKLQTEGFAQVINNDIIFTPAIHPNNISVPKRVRSRQTPFVVQRSKSYTDIVQFSIPEGMAFQFIPDAVSIENEFGSYEYSFEEVDEQHINFKRRVVFRKGVYAKEKYKSYRNYLKKINKTDNQKIVLQKT